MAAPVGSLAPALARDPEMAAAMTALAPEICLQTPLRDLVGCLDPTRPRITLRGDTPDGLLWGALLHELRHLDQLARGFCPDNTLTMRENARATFALEADASAVSLAMAWALRAAGDAEVREALAAWPQQGDIAAAFADAEQRSGDPAIATAAAFAEWYASSERRESYYLAACSDYLDREDSGGLLPGRAQLPAGFFDRSCRMPDGGSYPCIAPPGPLR